MGGPDLKRIRQGLKLSQSGLAYALGYRGSLPVLAQQVQQWESGKRAPIPRWIANLATMFELYGVPPEFLPEKVSYPLPKNTSYPLGGNVSYPHQLGQILDRKSRAK